jgi:hypothetical protein
MTATAAQIAEVRRMVDEPTVTTYSDTLIQGFIEKYPLMDELGTDPYYWNELAVPPAKVATIGWVPTYDLWAAAADIWDEKAAAVADEFDFTADGGNFSASQKYQHFVNSANRCRSKRAIKVIKLKKYPSENPRYPYNV